MQLVVIIAFLIWIFCAPSINGKATTSIREVRNTSCPGRNGQKISFPGRRIPEGLAVSRGRSRTISTVRRRVERSTTSDDVLGKIALAKQVDLCFLVDVTGSMSPYIKGVQNSIINLVNDLLKKQVTDLRLAFVGYRDFADNQDHFVISDFSTDVSKFKTIVSDTPAKGGAGTPEDVFGGLDRSLNLNWAHRDRTRLIFHIADAPAHGCEYHLLSHDDFPEGDPEGRKAEDLFANIREMDIEFYFGNITDSTNVMIEKFSEFYGAEIPTFDIGIGNLRGAAAERRAESSIFSSVGKAVSTSVRRKISAARRTSGRS